MSLAEINLNGYRVQVDLNNPLDISIPLHAGVGNPNCYNSDDPSFTPITDESGFIGSVANGGPCNHQRLEISPHGNGTHTECYGHIAPDSNATINQCLKCFHFMANLVTVTPEKATNGDLVLTWNSLSSKLTNTAPALIIRTAPNDASKVTKQYSGTNPPYLDHEFALEAVKNGVCHLLIDLPSVDKEEDGGKLQVHHDFWDYPQNPRKDSTITELIYVRDSIPDGLYLLNLQIASFESDASPSKPVLYAAISRHTE